MYDARVLKIFYIFLVVSQNTQQIHLKTPQKNCFQKPVWSKNFTKHVFGVRKLFSKTVIE